MEQLRITPLSRWHADHGGRMVDFAGYSMPVQFEGVLAEHRAVRSSCGLFDVSHMCELAITGSGARGAVDRLVTNNVARMERGSVMYTALCRDDGGVLDDLLVYCFADDDFLIVGNASNHARDAAWIADHLEGDAVLEDQTHGTALFALQGPASREVLLGWKRLARQRSRLTALDYYHAERIELDGLSMVLSRTGYTGELGYELYLPADDAWAVWEELLRVGEQHALRPVGLGARDTLRLEAGYSLYGHELDEDTTPLEAGIGWVVKLKAGPFVGRDALLQQKEAGVPRTTIGLKLEGRIIARQNAPIFAGRQQVGVVTSGTFSPTLERGIALARVDTPTASSPLQVEIRGRRHPVQRCTLPFVTSRVRD